MMLPAHPEHDDNVDPATPRRSRVLIGVGIALIVVLVVVLHLTGVIGGG